MEKMITRCQKSSDEIIEELKEAAKSGTLQDTLPDIFLKYEVDMSTLWKCRQFFLELPDDYYMSNPALFSCRILLEAMRGDLNRAERLLAMLGHMEAGIDPTKQTATDYIRILVELILPSISNAEFIRRAWFIKENMSAPITSFSLNACRPSIINGFRDFTEYCPHMEQKKDQIEALTETLYGHNSKGIYEVALAEWKYETNHPFDALILVAGTIPRLEDADDVRCLFVAFLLQMKILIGNGQTKASAEMFDKIRTSIADKGFEELESSLNAAVCLQDCYSGNREAVEKWLDTTAPDENSELFMMDVFAYFVKMRCYLQTDRYMLTLLLAKKLYEKLEPVDRPHDKCECCLMSAMACYKAGDTMHALEEFEKALVIGQKYGYIRLFGDEGQMMLELLRLQRTESTRTDISSAYLKKLKTVAQEMSRLFPNYLVLSKKRADGLTSTERTVLPLLAAGLSNDEIADKLGKKTGTIKFHTASIYRKLNVSSRQQAVNAARELGIL